MTQNTLNQKLHMAGFYYRGIDVILKEDIVPDLEGLIDVFERFYPEYEKGINEEGPDFVFEQLDFMIEQQRIRGYFDAEQISHWCMNIYCLTKMGHIQNDDFNGTQFMYFPA